MDKVEKSKCDKCGKDVWANWNSCPSCGFVLAAGKTRADIRHLPLRRD